jgi:hypothetical protein
MNHEPVKDGAPASGGEISDDVVRELLGDLFELAGLNDTTAATYADGVRHGAARVELLDCLADDAQVLARFEAWGREIGLIQATEEAASLADEVAQRCGLRGRFDVWQRRGEITVEPPDEAQDQALLQALDQAVERFLAALRRSDGVFDAACGYVRDELRLPWVWLAWGLAKMLLKGAVAALYGIEVHEEVSFTPEDPLAADVTFTFRTRPEEGETARAAQQRLQEEVAAVYAQIQPEPLPTGRLRKDLVEKTRRNVRWFYRHRVCHETPYAIAKEEHTKPHRESHPRDVKDCSCLRNVLDGIKEAERVLGLTPHLFNMRGEE